MHSNIVFRINLIQKTCNYICYNYVASFLHVLNVIINPANFAIKDMISKSHWISKSAVYLSQVVWEANETICKERLVLITLHWEVWKFLKHLVYYCHTSLTIMANTMFISSTMKCQWKYCKLNVICQLCSENFEKLNSK